MMRRCPDCALCSPASCRGSLPMTSGDQHVKHRPWSNAPWLSTRPKGCLPSASIPGHPRPIFGDRDLYVFVIDRAGTMAAHALFPEAVGQSAINARDPEGKFYVREMLERASETGVLGRLRVQRPHPGLSRPEVILGRAPRWLPVCLRHLCRGTWRLERKNHDNQFQAVR